MFHNFVQRLKNEEKDNCNLKIRTSVELRVITTGLAFDAD